MVVDEYLHNCTTDIGCKAEVDGIDCSRLFYEDMVDLPLLCRLGVIQFDFHSTQGLQTDVLPRVLNIDR